MLMIFTINITAIHINYFHGGVTLVSITVVLSTLCYHGGVIHFGELS